MQTVCQKMTFKTTNQK